MGDRLGTRSVLRFLLEAILAKRVIFKGNNLDVTKSSQKQVLVGCLNDQATLLEITL